MLSALRISSAIMLDLIAEVDVLPQNQGHQSDALHETHHRSTASRLVCLSQNSGSVWTWSKPISPKNLAIYHGPRRRYQPRSCASTINLFPFRVSQRTGVGPPAVYRLKHVAVLSREEADTSVCTNGGRTYDLFDTECA